MGHKIPAVLLLSSEATPYAKTGGLGDVAGSLAPALKRLGIELVLVLPFYSCIKENYDALEQICEFKVTLGYQSLKTTLWQIIGQDGLPCYLIGREDMFERPNLYGGKQGDYYDNFERFSFFCKAALDMIHSTYFRPNIVHCNDWQTGLTPAFIRGSFRHHPVLGKSKTVFSIHNIGYQGIFPAKRFDWCGLSEQDFFHPEGLEYWGKGSLLKAGIVYADVITTVSPRYAQEIQTPEYGMGMEGILKANSHKLYGIVNGIDDEVWNPAKDQYLPANYSVGDLSGKTVCKQALFRDLGLQGDPTKTPILCMVTRLDRQKGIELVLKSIPEVVKKGVCIVILASGEKELEEGLTEVASHYPGIVAFVKGFDEAKAHTIIAGSDMLLMPSRYEPCGLTQMYALKYGTIPVVRATGGLHDTVLEYDPETGKGNGFKFKSYDPKPFVRAIERALIFYASGEHWKKIMSNAMRSDFSWRRSAQKYVELYQSLLEDR